MKILAFALLYFVYGFFRVKIYLKKTNNEHKFKWAMVFAWPWIKFLKSPEREGELKGQFSSRETLGILLLFAVMALAIAYDIHQYNSGEFDGTRYGRPK